MNVNVASLWVVVALILSGLSAKGCTPAINEFIPREGVIRSAESPKDSNSVDEINRAIAAVAAQTALAASDYRIGPEDLLEITLFNIPASEATVTPRQAIVRVSQQGRLTLPLLGEIAAKDLTVAALEETLRQRYEQYIHNPQVGVLVREYRQRVSVIGAVQRPGVFELSGPKTVLDMVALAGGVNEKAGSQVHIYRQTPEGRQSEVIDLWVLTTSAGLINETNADMINMVVGAGDVVNVPQAGMFFVDGAVRKPGSYPLGRNYTLTQAIATAGGMHEDLAKPSGVTIVRRKNREEVKAIPVNLAEVSAGRIEDPQIQADDLVMVPMSTPKFIFRYYVSTVLGTTLNIQRLMLGF